MRVADDARETVLTVRIRLTSDPNEEGFDPYRAQAVTRSLGALLCTLVPQQHDLSHTRAPDLLDLSSPDVRSEVGGYAVWSQPERIERVLYQGDLWPELEVIPVEDEVLDADPSRVHVAPRFLLDPPLGPAHVRHELAAFVHWDVDAVLARADSEELLPIAGHPAVLLDMSNSFHAQLTVRNILLEQRHH